MAGTLVAKRFRHVKSDAVAVEDVLQQQLSSFADTVARHYEQKGYTIHRGRKVRGTSGAIYAADLIVQAPFGNLLVSFGDDGEVEGPEVGAVRTAAKDIGANPVVAARRVSPDVRHIATRLGVAVLDEAAIEEEAVQAPRLEDPTDTWTPWPASGSSTGTTGGWPTARDTVRRRDLDRTVRRESRFGWLQARPEPVAGPETEPAMPVAREAEQKVVQVPLRHVPRPPVPPLDWRMPLLYGTATGIVGGLVFFLLTILFL